MRPWGWTCVGQGGEGSAGGCLVVTGAATNGGRACPRQPLPGGPLDDAHRCGPWGKGGWHQGVRGQWAVAGQLLLGRVGGRTRAMRSGVKDSSSYGPCTHNHTLPALATRSDSLLSIIPVPWSDHSPQVNITNKALGTPCSIPFPYSVFTSQPSACYHNHSPRPPAVHHSPCFQCKRPACSPRARRRPSSSPQAAQPRANHVHLTNHRA